MPSGGRRQGWCAKTAPAKSYKTFFIRCFLLLLAPWIIQLLVCPPDHIPVGLFGGEADYFTFLAKTEWGRLGHWTWENLFTSEPTEPVRAYYFYLFLGHIAKWVDLSSAWVIQIARSLLGAVFLTLWWKICRRTEYPKTVFALGIWAGLGFFAHLNDRMAYLESCIQGHAARTGLIGFPHYLLDGIGFLLMVDSYLERKSAARFFLSGLLIGMAHPFLLPLVPTALFIHTVIYERKKIKEAFLCCLAAAVGGLVFSLPLFLDYLHIAWLRTWREQTGTGFHAWEHLYLVSLTFGLAGVLAWAAVPRMLKPGRDKLKQVSAVWLLTAGILAVSAPLPNSREYNMFLSLPVAVLSAPMIYGLAVRINSHRVAVLTVVFCCAFGAISTADMLVGSLFNPNTWVSSGFMEGAKYLEEHSSPGDVAACSLRTGNRLVYFTRRPRPYLAHVCETLDVERKKKEIQAFFMEGRALDVQWAVVSKEWDPEFAYPQGEPVFENDAVKIYRP